MREELAAKARWDFLRQGMSAFEQGRMDYRAHFGLDDNPYSPDSLDWEEGWWAEYDEEQDIGGDREW